MPVQVPEVVTCMCFCVQSFTFSMSSDEDFDDVAYKAFEDQLYEEQSLSGLVMLLTLFPHFLLSQTCGMSVLK